MDPSEWQAAVPGRIERSVRRWRLDLGEPMDGGSLGRVFACAGPNGEDLVLKLSPPIANGEDEARALAHWDGSGAAKLVAWDAPDEALLLERVLPGTFLMERDRSHLDDDLAVRAAADVLTALQTAQAPAEGSFPSFEGRLRWWLDYTARYGESEAAGTRMLPELERCAHALDASAPRRSLIHGDFVAKNLLLMTDGSYVAIDPVPCIGDPGSDIGQFSAYHSPVCTIANRARAIAEASGNSPERAAQWAAVWTVFQACETWRDDSDDVQAWVTGTECAELLRDCC